MIGDVSRATVIAPHPDDETIAVGGSISRLVDAGVDVSVLVVSGHLPPLYDSNTFSVTEQEAIEAFKILGVKNFKFSKIPATFVHSLPVSELTGLISGFLKETSPELVFIPFPDRHIDHRAIFDASVVACRPVGSSYPRLVLSYETLSETHWNVPGVEASFNPEFFIDITNFISRKESALKAYKSQINPTNARAIDCCTALARFRGSQNGCRYAEAFKVVRIVV